MKLLTSKEVAAMLGVPEGTLRYWRHAEIGPTWVKLEGSIRYHATDLEAYVKSNRHLPSVRALEERHGVV